MQVPVTVKLSVVKPLVVEEVGAQGSAARAFGIEEIVGSADPTRIKIRVRETFVRHTRKSPRITRRECQQDLKTTIQVEIFNDLYLGYIEFDSKIAL